MSDKIFEPTKTFNFDVDTKGEKRLDLFAALGDDVNLKKLPVINAEKQNRNLPADDDPNKARRAADEVTHFDTAKIETWNYSDGTSEKRYTANGGYMSLTRYDANKVFQDKFTIIGDPRGRQELEISRADGSTDLIVGSKGYAFFLPNWRLTTDSNGGKKWDVLPNNLADRTIETHRRIIKR